MAANRRCAHCSAIAALPLEFVSGVYGRLRSVCLFKDGIAAPATWTASHGHASLSPQPARDGDRENAMPGWRLGVFACGFVVAVSAGGAPAQDVYPSKPITLMHGFAAGGNSDTISRTIADPLSARLGQPVIVEARAGAGGNLASDK